MPGLRMCGAVPPITHVFMAWYLIKYRGNVPYLLHLQVHIIRNFGTMAQQRALLFLGPKLQWDTSGFRHSTFNFKN
jgi:hypothetical protein